MLATPRDNHRQYLWTLRRVGAPLRGTRLLTFSRHSLLPFNAVSLSRVAIGGYIEFKAADPTLVTDATVPQA